MLKIPFSHHLFRRRQMVWYSSLQLVSSFVSQSSLQDRLLASSSLRSRSRTYTFQFEFRF